MRKLILRLMLPVLSVGMLIGSGCNGSGRNGSDDSLVFATDSIDWRDSILLGECRSMVEITGQYPTKGNQILIDSLQTWIAGNLANGIPMADNPLFTPDSLLLANGEKLAAMAGKKLIEDSKRDFQDFIEDDISVTYDYSVNFRPIFESDSLLTYSFSSYGYSGGAHGAAAELTQTFNKNNGIRLTFANAFVPGSLDKLKEIIKNELWEQYFKPEIPADDSTEDVSLSDMLLIENDSLPLPVCPPYFMPDGIHIIYQQYEIACYAAGMPTCVIPYETVKPLLNADVKALIP